MPKLAKRMFRRVDTKQTVWNTCYHEAGHAVAALRLGLGIVGGTKIRTHDPGTRRYGGRIFLPGCVTAMKAEPKEYAAIFLTAGAVAEEHYNKYADSCRLSLDQENFRLVMQVEGTEFMKLWDDYSRFQTRSFITQNWAAVSALARAFIRQKHHTLSKKQIIKVIGVS
jgi:hypothetical protein